MVGRSQVPGLHLHLGCSAGPGIRVCAAESLPSSAGHSLSLSRSARVGQLRPFALLQRRPKTGATAANHQDKQGF
ncbi:hypothetical protein LMH87_010401 [Akanthomyces muscarius]|uniref:Uncharacterized protein n=1 Tax=Akanthomyces muscarius TaxID=2231603 RepID=A0A9W8QD90_AKAMU|nr:hypothetical protein LMH87_010401 [Akanthomyces muscarius]KAJ4153935.1 hypothetical protein LMH87_010401 [Akanthomyces muscarius]